MKASVLVFSGPIASGKTTIALQLATRLGWIFASFGDYVRSEAIRKGLNSKSRNILQNIGNELIKSGWDKFCFSVLRSANWNQGEGLIIDGIRHIEGLDAIKTIVQPLETYLMYVYINKKVRQHRLEHKNINNGIELENLERHGTELQVKNKLRSLADFEIDGAMKIEKTTEDIINWFSKK